MVDNQNQLENIANNKCYIDGQLQEFQLYMEEQLLCMEAKISNSCSQREMELLDILKRQTKFFSEDIEQFKNDVSFKINDLDADLSSEILNDIRSGQNNLLNRLQNVEAELESTKSRLISIYFTFITGFILLYYHTLTFWHIVIAYVISNITIVSFRKNRNS